MLDAAPKRQHMLHGYWSDVPREPGTIKLGLRRDRNGRLVYEEHVLDLEKAKKAASELKYVYMRLNNLSLVRAGACGLFSRPSGSNPPAPCG
jgi:hypothetical protein